MNSWSSGQPKNDAKTPFFHPPSPFHGKFCNCNSIGICTASQFYVQLPLLYTAWSNAYSEIGLEVRCDLLWLLAWKITKRIHSSKPASVNRPIHWTPHYGSVSTKTTFCSFLRQFFIRGSTVEWQCQWGAPNQFFSLVSLTCHFHRNSEWSLSEHIPGTRRAQASTECRCHPVEHGHPMDGRGQGRSEGWG